MYRTFLTAKLHHARVTAVELGYQGSLSIDTQLLAASGIAVHEQILVANLRNGARFTTYAIPAPAGSGVVQVNGAAAHQCAVGDKLIIMAYGQLTPAEVKKHQPKVIILGDGNRPIKPAAPKNAKKAVKAVRAKRG